MKNLKTNWLLKHTLTVFSCVLIVVLGIAFLSHADPVTTTIGENIATNDLSVTGNVTAGTWQGTAIDTEYGGTGADWSAVAQGNLPYFSAEGTLSNLAPGTAGQFLQSGGTGADPAWANVTRSATFVVAANDSSALSKQQADYVCDGTDDQVEIQAAIDALPSGGGKVVLMEGEFSISSSIRLKENALVAGQGMQSTIVKLANNANCNIFEWTPISTEFFAGLFFMKIFGNKDNNTTGHGLYTSATSGGNPMDFHSSNVFYYGCAEDSVHLDYSWGYKFTDCLFEGSLRDGIYNAGSQLTVMGTYIAHNGRDGVRDSGHHNNYMGIVAQNNTEEGFHVSSGYNISGSIISKDNGKNGILINGHDCSLFINSEVNSDENSGTYYNLKVLGYDNFVTGIAEGGTDVYKDIYLSGSTSQNIINVRYDTIQYSTFQTEKHKNIINGVATNPGDPNSVDPWGSLNKEDGLIIVDINTNTVYLYDSRITGGRIAIN